MKYIQTKIRKYMVCIATVFVVTFSASAQSNAYLTKADTLFKAKQFTQSFELYEQLFKQGKYSPAMLLKMAYIQEGSGHISKALYYLTLYNKVSGDERVLTKIDELATNNKLEGYAVSPADKFFAFMEKYFIAIAGGLAAIILLFMALALAQKRKKQPTATFVALAVIFIGVLGLHANFSEAPKQGITGETATYLMSGPSAGASVVAIVGDGNQVRITGENDVWVRVEWGEKEAWVRNNALWREKI